MLSIVTAWTAEVDSASVSIVVVPLLSESSSAGCYLASDDGDASRNHIGSDYFL